ncbi:uncharacterized protein LOC108632688 isoform X2 [Ceratina calcarata]|uniref:Uncharacterized protein LOC108632688 isoform X2 n=1 Tax=Ceratina calcarata TaxID=156304 RepID=A0AAJ7JHP5_9HYME|nr:uncharacterized protein LOC108632688 isoform X2 [Ceratina calcarata]
MNISPVANTSFLHGDRKTSPASEKIVYATLDSLALKGTTLPLQLYDNNVKAEGTDESKISGCKVNTARLSSRNRGKYLLAVPPSKSKTETDTRTRPELNPQPESNSISRETNEDSDIDGQDQKRSIVCSRVYHCTDNSDIDVNFTEIEVKMDIEDTRETAIRSPDIECSFNNVDVGREPIVLVGSSENFHEETPSSDYEIVDSNFFHRESGEDWNRDIFVKSKSTNDLVSKNYSSDLRINGRVSRLVETHSEEKLTERSIFGKKYTSCAIKKKHFAKNMFRLMPEYLGYKKTDVPIESPSSSRTLSGLDMKMNSKNQRRSKKNHFRENFSCSDISSPTNFVHVASATNPSLVSNENAVRFSNLEQIVIMHEQKCATLPLLVAHDRRDADRGNSVENQTQRPTIEGTATSSHDFDADGSKDKCKRDALDIANLKRELLSELQGKVLETGQRQVKTNEREQEENARERKTCVSSSRAEAPVNFSFLWSVRNKNLSPDSSRSTPNENVDAIDEGDEQYDDVGPLHLISVPEDDYDDVSSPLINEPCDDLQDDIYDDVVPKNTGNASAGERRAVDYRDDDDDFSVANEYSSVDEDGDCTDNDPDVYDDVGLPSKERVNSLYAAGSSLYAGLSYGPSLVNTDKESEWEDLEEIGESSSSKKTNSSTETQVVSSRRRTAQRWCRKTKRQRSRRVSKKCPTLSSRSAVVPRKTTFDVAVSLGSGSILLVGYTEKIEEWKKERREDATTRENSPRTQGLVQMRVIDLDEDVDTQEMSCYVHEDNASDDSTYESLHSFQPDDFSTDSETEKIDDEISPDQEREKNSGEKIERNASNDSTISPYLEAPTKPNPPPPREISLSRTLGRQIKMLRRTWSITKGSLGRMRMRKTSGERAVSEPISTFYLNGYIERNNGDDIATATTRKSYTGSSNEPMYGNTSEQLDRYSVLADQEPLYQFYAAAAARVAFDSSSECYDDVEDTIPSRSTKDLATGPGHRTLWCQTPRVINDGLLQRLTAEEKKMQEAKFEILTSEASYLNSLRVLNNEFLNEPSLDEVLTPNEKDRLFAGIPAILQASEQFLAELEVAWSHDPMLHALPDVLLKQADKFFDIYVAYCTNQVNIDTTLKDLRTRKGSRFIEIISQIESRPACQSLSLHSFLMLPMQRITRLPLLADAVLSKLSPEREDRSDWEKVLSTLNYIVVECNESARVAVKAIEIENLARKLEYSAKIKPIPLEGKQLVKSGRLVRLSTKNEKPEYKLTFRKRFAKTPLYLLLLTDYLLVAKYKSNTQDETYNVIDACKRSLIALESVPEDSPFAGRNAMLLTLLENYSGHQVEYVLTCDSDTERQRWLDAVAPTKRGLIGETLYEAWDCPQVVALYSYSPNQPDELSLQPGDVINVFRKMSDGWYQGGKLLNGEQGWFPGNYTKEVASEHVRAKNLKQRHRFLAIGGNVLQPKTKQQR